MLLADSDVNTFFPNKKEAIITGTLASDLLRPVLLEEKFSVE